RGQALARAQQGPARIREVRGVGRSSAINSRWRSRMTDQPNGERIATLVGEGGCLYLYRYQRGGSTRFAGDTLWQIPDEEGRVPQKIPAWKGREYTTLTSAFEGAPSYWPFLMPAFVHSDIRDEIWSLVSNRLSNGQPPNFAAQCLPRWERACNGGTVQ